MADQNGTKNPWESDDSSNAWNPSGAPTGHDSADSSDSADSGNSAEPASTDAAPATSIPSSGIYGGGTNDGQPTAAQTPVSAAPSGTDAPTTQIHTGGSPYSPAPQYGANTANPTQPLPASSYPFGAPEKQDDSKKQQNTQGNQNGSSSFNPFGFGGQSQNGAPSGSGNGGAGNNAMNNGSQNPQGQPGNFPFGGPAGPAGPGDPNGPAAPGGGQNNNGGAHSTGKTGGARTWIAAAASAIIAALLVLGLGYAAIANGLVTLPSSSSTSSLTSSSGGSGTAKVEGTNSPDWASVNKKVAASVVSISAEVTGGVAKGSGAIIDKDGDIVTNNHVIEGASQIQVSLSNGKLYSAKLVGTDTTTDLAVIKLQNPPSDLQPVTFADSSNLAVGESVMAIGNPLGYENTATTGIVSALNRPVSVTDESSQSEIVTNAIQIDASINPGNSGGPTFNAAGQVVGINSSIATASTSSSSDSESGSIGIGFAIPSTLVQRVAKQIVKSGKATHAQLGVTITTGTAESDDATLAGAKINSVTSGGPAAKAGLQKGDVIVGFDGNTVSSMYSLLGFVRAASVGDTVKLTVVRNSKTVEVDVTLTEAESTSSSDSSDSNNNNDEDNGDSGSGNSDGDSGSGDGGLSDPFGLFGGQ